MKYKTSATLQVQVNTTVDAKDATEARVKAGKAGLLMDLEDAINETDPTISTENLSKKEKDRKQKISFLKINASGYIGGEEIIKKATDDEIHCIAEWKDELARLHNSAIEPKKFLEKMIKTIEAR